MTKVEPDIELKNNINQEVGSIVEQTLGLDDINRDMINHITYNVWALVQPHIRESKKQAVEGFIEELKSNWTGLLKGNFKLTTGDITLTLKSPKEGTRVIFENKIDYAGKQYLSTLESSDNRGNKG